MATNGSITTGTKEGRSVTLAWSLSSQDIANNTSTIYWTLKGSGSATGWVKAGGFKAVINGVTVYSSSTNNRIQLKNGTVVASGNLNIPHNADGTKSFNLSCEAGVYTYAVSVYASGTHTINTIPRASSVSAQSVELGKPSTISIYRATSSFSHTLTYSFGNASGTIVSKTASTSVSWTPPISLASQIPSTISGNCTITCTTYNGNSSIGTKSCTISLSVPSNIKPTIESLTASRIDGDVPNTWGIYVQTKSKADITINGASGSYGSTIKSYSINGGGYSSTASTLTTGFLNSSGTINFNATVTDSRGRTSDAKQIAINVTDYMPPTFNSYTSLRCKSDGTLFDEGTYIKGLINYNYSSCNSKNSVKSSIYYRIPGNSNWINTSTTFNSNTNVIFGNGKISADNSYEVCYELKDTFNTITVTDIVSTASVVMDFKAGGNGVAVGKVSEYDNALELSPHWDLRVYGKKLVDYIYPVGSIYMSVNQANPELLFGGTWEKIEDRFLLAAGSKYASGSVGGEESHSLTIEEQPKLTGYIQFRQAGEFNILDSFTNVNNCFEYIDHGGNKWGNRMATEANNNDWNKNALVTYNNGGKNMAHNNMPPYLTVYMWKRTD